LKFAAQAEIGRPDGRRRQPDSGRRQFGREKRVRVAPAGPAARAFGLGCRNLNSPRARMNLIVATRIETLHIRFEVSGRWRYGDALKLAYMLKSAAARTSLQRFLVDLRGVTSEPDNAEKFLVCDRLLRVFHAPYRIALIGDAALIDSDTAVTVAPDAPSIALFPREGEALNWLMG
jgi:hypothetical protein